MIFRQAAKTQLLLLSCFPTLFDLGFLKLLTEPYWMTTFTAKRAWGFLLTFSTIHPSNECSWFHSCIYLTVTRVARGTCCGDTDDDKLLGWACDATVWRSTIRPSVTLLPDIIVFVKIPSVFSITCSISFCKLSDSYIISSCDWARLIFNNSKLISSITARVSSRTFHISPIQLSMSLLSALIMHNLCKPCLNFVKTSFSCSFISSQLY
jgi:hypothetical protein